LLAGPAGAALITTEHYHTWAEVEAHVIGGFEFFARGDTEKLRMTRTDPPAEAHVPFDIWNSGVPHGFKVVYNAGGIAGISIDDVYTVQLPVSISPLTNGLLVTAFADGADRSVLVSNLKLTLPPFNIYDVGDVAFAPATDYLLIETDLPLAGGFILSGTVTFSWSGSLPPADQQWFEVTPVITPEPAAYGLLLAGPLLLRIRRSMG